MAVLKKELTLFQTLSFVTGGIIGSGIFLTPNSVFKEVGSPGMLFLVFSLTGLWSLAAQLCYAELGTLIPVSGGEYAFLKYTFSSSLPAFSFAWSAWIVLRPISISILALTYAHYAMAAFVVDCDFTPSAVKCVAISIVVLVCAINCIDTRWLAKIQGVLLWLKLLSMLFLIILGFVALGQKRQSYVSDGFHGTSSSFTSIGLGFYGAQWAFAGWADANYFVAELKDPKILVTAAFIAIPLVTCCYLLVDLAYMAILPRAVFESSTTVAVAAGQEMIGTPALVIIPLFVAVACIGTANSVVMSSSRLVHEGGKRGDLPKVLGLVHNSLSTPIIAVIMQCSVAIFYIAFIDVQLLVVLLAFSADLVFGTSMIILLLLRRREPDSVRGIKVPLIVPILVFIPCVIFTVVPFIRYPVKTAVTSLLLLSSVPVYFVFVSRRFGKRLHPFLDRITEWSVVTAQKWLDIS